MEELEQPIQDNVVADNQEESEAVPSDLKPEPSKGVLRRFQLNRTQAEVQADIQASRPKPHDLDTSKPQVY